MGRLIEGLWDCPYCGTKGIKGSIRQCTCCGKQRGNDTKFYMPGQKVYVDEEKAKTISKQPDWLCSFCDSYNVATNNVCNVCGHTKDESDINYFEQQKKNEKEELKRQANLYENDNIREDSEGNIVYDNDYLEDMSDRAGKINLEYGKLERRKKNRKRKSNVVKNIFTIGGISLAVIAFIAFMVFLFVPHEADFLVTEASWTHYQEIEEYRTVQESDWSVPPGGRVKDEKQEIYSYQQVLDHYETKTKQVAEQVLDHYETVVTGHRDLGNGYFEEITSQRPVYKTVYKTETYQEPVYRQEPIYRTKYYYEIDKWVYDRTIRSSGNDKNIVYKEYTLDTNERDGSSGSTYSFTGTIEEKEHTFSTEKRLWDVYNVGDIIKVKINKVGIITIIEND